MLKYSKLQVYEILLKTQITEFEKIMIVSYLVNKHNLLLNTDFRYKKNFYSFPVTEHINFFSNLYDEFFNISEKLFGTLTLTSNNKKTCWAQVSNSDVRNKNIIHNHSKTSVINAVYYLSVPDKNSGKILFYDDNHNLLEKHQPVENSLLIFPNNLNHCPEKCNSDEYRIAINMEINCDEKIW